MSENEEKKEEKKEEKQEAAKEEKKHEKKEEKETQAEATAESASGDKRKKISRMTLAEVEKEIKSAQEKMGGLRSSFARVLLARKQELSAAKR